MYHKADNGNDEVFWKMPLTGQDLDYSVVLVNDILSISWVLQQCQGSLYNNMYMTVKSVNGE